MRNPAFRMLGMAWLLPVWALLQTQAAHACRYNVRDAGFVDLGEPSYLVYGYISNDTAPAFATKFEQICYAALMDANVTAEVVNVDAEARHPAVQHLDEAGIESLPAVLLVSPDGRALPLSSAASGASPDDSLWTIVDQILSSPTRERLLSHLSSAYGVVLLVDGADEQKNAAARGAVDGAIASIASRMGEMPKSVAHPPVVVPVPRDVQSRERILLWSLGIEMESLQLPCAAAIYGKARQIGPVLQGDDITKDRLIGILALIGADCECTLDSSLLRGPKLLIEWPETVQTAVAENLGFDPENPVVKTEVSQILGQAGRARQGAGSSDPYSNWAVGYEELSVELKDETTESRLPPLQTAQMRTRGGEAEEARPPEPGDVHGNAAPWSAALYVGLALGGVVVAVGVGILLRARAR